MTRDHRHSQTPGRLLALVAAVLLALATPAAAQSLFAPVVRVNDDVITAWEVDQRARFLTLFRTPGDVREIAIERLIEERLQVQAARAAGIVATPEGIQAGMTEFAARTNLPLEQFIQAIGQGGVTEEAFRDFVRAGLVWRELVRTRFADAARPDTRDVDARLLEVGTEGGTRVLLYEIILPAGDPATQAASRARAAELARLTDEEAFRTAARRFSRAPTRIRGGELDWLAVTGLPEPVQAAIARLGPGQVSSAVDLGQNIGLFYLRERETIPPTPAGTAAIDFAVINLGSAETAARTAAAVQTCDDFYPLAKGLPEDRLRRETLPERQLPADIAAALAPLDPGETATLPGAPGTLVMFCARTLDTPAALNRDAVGQELLGTRLAERAALLLAQLRANATITRVE